MPPMTPSASVSIPQSKPSSVGPFIGTILVVAILLLGALYFWGKWLNEQELAPLPYIPNDPAITQ